MSRKNYHKKYYRQKSKGLSPTEDRIISLEERAKNRRDLFLERFPNYEELLSSFPVSDRTIVKGHAIDGVTFDDLKDKVNLSTRQGVEYRYKNAIAKMENMTAPTPTITLDYTLETEALLESALARSIEVIEAANKKGKVALGNAAHGVHAIASNALREIDSRDETLNPCPKYQGLKQIAYEIEAAKSKGKIALRETSLKCRAIASEAMQAETLPLYSLQVKRLHLLEIQLRAKSPTEALERYQGEEVEEEILDVTDLEISEPILIEENFS